MSIGRCSPERMVCIVRLYLVGWAPRNKVISYCSWSVAEGGGSKVMWDEVWSNLGSISGIVSVLLSGDQTTW